MDREELYRLIQKKEKEYGRAKLKRFVLTVLGYAAAICYLAFGREFEGVTILSLDGLITLADTYLPSVFIAIPFVFFSIPVFNWLFEESASENKHIEDLKKQLNDMDK